MMTSAAKQAALAKYAKGIDLGKQGDINATWMAEINKAFKANNVFTKGQSTDVVELLGFKPVLFAGVIEVYHCVITHDNLFRFVALMLRKGCALKDFLSHTAFHMSSNGFTVQQAICVTIGSCYKQLWDDIKKSGAV